jgi:hypothetical protein
LWSLCKAPVMVTYFQSKSSQKRNRFICSLSVLASKLFVLFDIKCFFLYII